jgi:hypothetical protein
MTKAADRLRIYREALVEDIESFVSGREVAQNGLVRMHIAAVGEGGSGLIAGPLCLALAEALEVSAGLRHSLGRVVGCTELSALSLRALRDDEAESVAVVHGLPLGLNSSDALYSLAHLALLDLVASTPRSGPEIAGKVDATSLEIWQAALGAASPAGIFDDWSQVLSRTGKLAGEVVALTADRGEEAVDALGRFGSQAALTLSGSGPVSQGGRGLASLGPDLFSQQELEKLASLLE